MKRLINTTGSISKVSKNHRKGGVGVLKYKGFLGLLTIVLSYILWGEHLGTSIFKIEWSYDVFDIVTKSYFILALLLLYPVRYFNRASGIGAIVGCLIWIIASIIPGFISMYNEKFDVHLWAWDLFLWELIVPINIGGVQIIAIIVLYLHSLYYRTKVDD